MATPKVSKHVEAYCRGNNKSFAVAHEPMKAASTNQEAALFKSASAGRVPDLHAGITSESHMAQ
jgi:hypothetical protein